MNSKRSLRPMFARRFFKALAAMKLRRRRRRSRSTLFTRARQIKFVSDISLASAATACNRKQAWSRAVLKRGQAVSKDLHRRQMVSVLKTGSRPLSRSDVLRGLVPGGKKMDFCCLLEEAGDYVRALSAQVQVMQFMLESVSP